MYNKPFCSVAARVRVEPPSPLMSVSVQYTCKTPIEYGSPHISMTMTVAATKKDHALQPPSTGGRAEAADSASCPEFKVGTITDAAEVDLADVTHLSQSSRSSVSDMLGTMRSER